MAQLVARTVWDREVPGSSPGSPTNYMKEKIGSRQTIDRLRQIIDEGGPGSDEALEQLSAIAMGGNCDAQTAINNIDKLDDLVRGVKKPGAGWRNLESLSVLCMCGVRPAQTAVQEINTQVREGTLVLNITP